MTRLHDLVAQSITEACGTGEFREDLDPDDAAFLVIGLVQGLALRWSLSGRTFGLVEEGSRLLELQIRGFAPTPVTETRERRLA